MYGELTHAAAAAPRRCASRRCSSTPASSGSCAKTRSTRTGLALGDLIEIVEVPGGHMVYWDAYEETADALERVLDAG